MKPAEGLKRSRGGHKAHATRLKKALESARKPRFPRLSPEEQTVIFRHWLRSDQIHWTRHLLRLAIQSAGRQGVTSS
jgi:hypothetical protein